MDYQPVKYRAEVDGLRAVAIVSVMLFHGGFEAFRGGFIGVDVFFVISGYLIASIILEDRASDQFSLTDFYERRARRILPALFVVAFACIVPAVALMLPDDLDVFGQSLVATAIFANNVLLWLTSGYFGLANEFKPLMHTWSIGVEAHFYILFPALILALTRVRRDILVPALATLALTSFAFALVQEARDPLGRFLLLPSRLWEFALGALLAATHCRSPGVSRGEGRWREIGAALGLFLIGLCVIAPQDDPMAQVLLPALGTVLVIHCAGSTTLAGRLLSARPVMAVGLISYSAYLWHQPLLAFLRLRRLEEPGGFLTLAALSATFPIAYASWRWIEQPVRKRRVTTGQFVATALLGGALLISIGLAFHRSAGLLRPWGEDTATVLAMRHKNAAYNEAPWRFNRTEFDATPTRKILVMGNSFARDFINMATENGYFSGADVVYRHETPECAKSAASIAEPLRSLISRADYLIFAGSAVSRACWSEVEQILSSLSGGKLIVVGTKDFGWNPPAVLHLPAAERGAVRTAIKRRAREQNEADRLAFPPDVFVDVLNALADPSGRVPVTDEDGQLLSQDGRHVTPEGAKYLGRLLFKSPILQALK